MVNVLIRDVSPQVHAGLIRRATANGMSLQQFLRAELGHLVERPSMAEVLERIERRLAASTEPQEPFDSADLIRQAREDRDAELAERIWGSGVDGEQPAEAP